MENRCIPLWHMLAEFDIVDNLDSSALLDFVKVDLAKCILSIVADDVKYTINNKNLDPFGDFNGGLQQFQIELDNKHFSGQVINSLPDVLKRMYRAYYDLDY